MKQIGKKFLHIPKTAGLSLGVYFDLHLKRSELLPSRVNSDRRQNNWRHECMDYVRPEIISAYDWFTVVRNPWDRLVSRYNYGFKINEGGLEPGTTFKQFWESRPEYADDSYFPHAFKSWPSQKRYLGSHADRFDCLNYHNLKMDIKIYLDVDLQAHRNKSKNKKDYKSYYDKKLIQEVADYYSDDIEYWGFDFDTGPKRNIYNVL